MKKNNKHNKNITQRDIEKAGYEASLTGESPDELFANTLLATCGILEMQGAFLCEKLSETFNNEIERNHIYLEMAALIKKSGDELSNKLNEIFKKYQRQVEFHTSQDIDNILKKANEDAAKLD